MDEKEILRRIDENKNEGFYSFIEEYQNLVTNVAYSFIGNRADAEDIAQEVFIKIYDKIHTFRGEAKLSTWIYRVTMNTCYNELRKRKSRKKFMATDYDSLEIKTYDTPIEEKELQREIHDAIQSLPPDFRAVVILKEFENKDYDEMAEILGCPKGTIASRLNRARQMLKIKLAEQGEYLQIKTRVIPLESPEEAESL